MRCKYVFAILFIFFITLTTTARAKEINAGFVTGIWYSARPFFSGDQIRIYTAIQNSSEFDIIGKVEFLDGEMVLGQKDFAVIRGRVVDTWIDWKATAGDHRILLRMKETMITEPGKDPRPVLLQSAQSLGEELFIDSDTDGDAIGNRNDDDDDNDGVSDQEEKNRGTNPVKADSDGGGINKSSLDDRGVSENLETQVSATKKIASNITKKTQNVLEQLRDEIAKRRDYLKAEIEKRAETKESVKGSAVEVKGKEGQEKETSMAEVSFWKKAYLWLLNALLFILNRWWLTLIVVVIILLQVWKMVFRRRRF